MSYRVKLYADRAVLVLSFIALAQSVGPFARAQPSTLPNIVYILADDMGIGDIRSYNPTSPVDTPNIDRIASAGMRFDNAHSSSSVCSPTRYSLLTGQYAWRTRLQAGVVLPHERALIDSSRLTVAEVLQQNGYSTAAIGKWHLGMNWVTTNGGAPLQNGTNVDYSQPFTGGPTDHGFDTYFGDDIINWPPYTWIRDNRTVGSDLQTPDVPVGQNGTNTPYLPPGGHQAGLVTPGYSTNQVLQTITSEAESYIESRAGQANPFFLYFPLTAPHQPILPLPQNLVPSTGTGAYGDFIAAVDWVVGQVLDRLEDPNGDNDNSDSIVDNTMIVFAADNGSDALVDFSTSPGAIDGQPLRGAKGSILEGGHREPLLIQWNGRVLPGSTSSRLIDLNDFMATVADVLDYELPANAAEDSYSFAPLLLGQNTNDVRTTSIQHGVRGAFSFREVDAQGNEWKLIFTAGDGGYSDFGHVHPSQPIGDFSNLQLYNVATDPGEQNNLLAGGGTPEMQQKALVMQDQLQGFMNSGRSVPAGTPQVEEDKVIRVDFGINTQRTTAIGWNNFTGEGGTRPTSTLNLLDETGAATGIQLVPSWSADNGDAGIAALTESNYDGPYPEQLDGIPQSALRDGVYVRDGLTLTMTLQNLDAHAAYDFLFYGAAGNTGDYSRFTVTGATDGVANITPLVDNATIVGTVNGIMPDASNAIVVVFEGRRPDGSAQLPAVEDDGLGRFNFMQITQHLLPVPGDFNGDRLVTAADYNTWRANFGSTTNLDADGNDDGIVDAADYVVWRNAMASSGGGAELADASQLVPEPHSAAMLLGVVFSCGRLSRRRLRRAR